MTFASLKTAQLGKLHVDDVRSAAANDFVGRERHADARAAYEHRRDRHAVGHVSATAAA